MSVGGERAEKERRKRGEREWRRMEENGGEWRRSGRKQKNEENGVSWVWDWNWGGINTLSVCFSFNNEVYLSYLKAPR